MAQRGISRRGMLAWVGAALGARPGDTVSAARRAGAATAEGAATARPDLDQDVLRRCADVLLPSDLDSAARDAAVTAFVRWVDGYRGDAEMDHGYGFTRLRRTAPHPEPGYAADVQELTAAARARHGRALLELDDADLAELVSATIEAATPGLETLPGRPDNAHVLVAFMSHWFRGPGASDRAYGVRIGRTSCRGLFTDVDGLEPLAGD